MVNFIVERSGYIVYKIFLCNFTNTWPDDEQFIRESDSLKDHDVREWRMALIY